MDYTYKLILFLTLGIIFSMPQLSNTSAEGQPGKPNRGFFANLWHKAGSAVSIPRKRRLAGRPEQQLVDQKEAFFYSNEQAAQNLEALAHAANAFDPENHQPEELEAIVRQKQKWVQSHEKRCDLLYIHLHSELAKPTLDDDTPVFAQNFLKSCPVPGNDPNQEYEHRFPEEATRCPKQLAIGRAAVEAQQAQRLSEQAEKNYTKAVEAVHPELEVVRRLKQAAQMLKQEKPKGPRA